MADYEVVAAHLLRLVRHCLHLLFLKVGKLVCLSQIFDILVKSVVHIIGTGVFAVRNWCDGSRWFIFGVNLLLVNFRKVIAAVGKQAGSGISPTGILLEAVFREGPLLDSKLTCTIQLVG